MSRAISYIKIILSHKWASIAILLISIVSRILQLIFFYNIRVDRSYQLLATQNFVHGNGISTASVASTDLSLVIYTPLIKWPPGYSLLVSPFYSLTGNNYLISSIIIEIIFSIILLVTSRAILKLLNTPLFLINIYTLVSSLFLYYFYFITSSDAVATTLFIIAIYFTLCFLKNRLALSKAVSLISFFLIACAFMKYIFMPAVFVIPLLILYKGFIDKNTLQLKAGVITIFLIAAAIASMLLYQRSISGNLIYVSDATRGVFIENLLSAYPVIPAAIIKPETIAMLFKSQNIGADILSIFQIIYVAFLLFFSTLLVRHFINTKFKQASLLSDLFYITIGTSICTILLLTFLSLRVAKAGDSPAELWTFIQEPRYYGLLNYLIHICIFAFSQFIIQKGQKKVKFFFYFLLICLLPELFRGCIFTGKRIFNLGKEEYSWQTDLNIQKFADEIIIRAKEKYPEANTVVTGSSYYFNNRISLYSYVPILHEGEKINTPEQLKTKKDILLLIVLTEASLPEFAPFISGVKKELVGFLNGFYFYTVYVTAH